MTWTIGTGNGITAEDFEALTGKVSFTGNETSKTITVKVKGDALVEGDEHFTVTLSNPTDGAQIGTATASGTILNDDQSVTVINHAPTGIEMSGPVAAAEYAARGTVVGTLTAIDPDTGDSLSFALSKPDDRFEIVGNQLVVKNGFKLDYEQATSHQVIVRVTDQSGATFDKAFTIGVIDVVGEVTPAAPTTTSSRAEPARTHSAAGSGTTSCGAASARMC